MPGRPIPHTDAQHWLHAVQNGTAIDVPEFRRVEARAILNYWPTELRDRGASVDGAWGSMHEPTRWHDVDRSLVHEFVEQHLARHGAWPTVALLRREFGRVTNHRLTGEASDQEQLDLGEFDEGGAAAA